MPRSGTTWLAKIFDSHPDVLYRHEPDSVYRTTAIPPFVAPPYQPHQLAIAADYFRTLCAARTVKVVGTSPSFPKSYVSRSMIEVQRTLVLGAKLGERIPLVGAMFKRMSVPDLVRSEGQIPIVIKSINALGRAGLFMAALPDLKAVVIMRHPCGHIASVLHGIRSKKFQASVPITEDMGVYRNLAELPFSRNFGLDLGAFREMSPIERLAWRWAITNTAALEALNDHSNARIIRYEDLCIEPISLSRSLFEFAGLEWNEQTESFINASTQPSANERFYQVFKNPATSANRWRQELAPSDIDRIARIAEQTLAGRLFTSDQSAALC